MREPHVRELQERFGIPDSALDSLEAVFVQDTVFVATPEAMAFDTVRPMRRGIRLCRVFPRSVKPTTFAMQVLGKHATRNCIDLAREDVVRLMRDGQIDSEAEVENGFVLVRCLGFTVGVGLYKRPVLKSQIPRHRPVEE